MKELTAEQIAAVSAAVSAALPGWRHVQWEMTGDAFYAPGDVLEWVVQSGALALPESSEGIINLTDWPAVRALGDQAAAAAALLEQFATEQEGKK